MWNLLVSTLLLECTVMQFDGNPGHPDLDTLWRFAERERITFFGTSPAFIGLNMKAGMKPSDRFDLSALRTVGCTGSPLTPEGYRWVYEHVHPDVLLASISGGTDPGAAFVGAVVGEYLGSASGVGYLILQAEGVFDINSVFAGVLVLTACAR